MKFIMKLCDRVVSLAGLCRCCHCTLHWVISMVCNTCIKAYFGIRIILIASLITTDPERTISLDTKQIHTESVT